MASLKKYFVFYMPHRSFGLRKMVCFKHASLKDQTKFFYVRLESRKLGYENMNLDCLEEI